MKYKTLYKFYEIAYCYNIKLIFDLISNINCPKNLLNLVLKENFFYISK